MTEQLNLFDHWPHYLGPVIGHPVRDVHRNMIARCTNPNHHNFPNYGGRGIFVDAAFRSSRSFIGWAIWKGWRPGLQLDRRNNDGPYSPLNCRFVTPSENAINQRKTIRLVSGKPALPLALSSGIASKAFYSRIYRGWAPDDAATVPSGGMRPCPSLKGGDA